MIQDSSSPSTHKVRRLTRGGKRGEGWKLQREQRRVQRPNPSSVRVGKDDRSLTSVAGLVDFGAFCHSIGLHRDLRRRFGHLKSGRLVVYPMAAQLQLLLDLSVAGEGRVFGLEAMAHDPLFVHLAGGHVPSVDVLYDDLARFGEEELGSLESMMAEPALARLRKLRPERIHVDIDTTVTVLFGSQEGALPGPNPRYHGRPSHHPMLARVAEVDGVIGAMLRPGDTGFGGADIPAIVAWLTRLREAVGPQCIVTVRIDAAADCTELLAALDKLGVFYIVKAKISQDMANAIACARWSTVDADAMDKPTRQVATVDFLRKAWRETGLAPRVVAVRSRERDNGKQVFLWNDLDYTVQAYITNDWTAPADDIARDYDGRAGIEPLIAELKNGYGIGKAPSAIFHANHAALLLKLLAYNLFRAYLAARLPALSAWRTTWARRVVVQRAGRLVRSARRFTLRAQPLLVPMLC